MTRSKWITKREKNITTLIKCQMKIALRKKWIQTTIISQNTKTTNKPNKTTNEMEFIFDLSSVRCGSIDECIEIHVMCWSSNVSSHNSVYVCNLLHCIALRCISSAIIKYTLGVYHFNETAHQASTPKNATTWHRPRFYYHIAQ